MVGNDGPIVEGHHSLTTCFTNLLIITAKHGGGRQPMCDPEGCSTVWGAVGGGGGDPHPPPKGGGGTPPPPLG